MRESIGRFILLGFSAVAILAGLGALAGVVAIGSRSESLLLGFTGVGSGIGLWRFVRRQPPPA